MRCEVVAVGTELLLGAVVDTNSARIGEHLALAGIDCHFQTRVGDNVGRITTALRLALERSDAVLVCGGLGPTPDDVTRDAIAAVMGVSLERDDEMVERIRGIFESRRREMANTNVLQADLPRGARFILQERGTAPGLICPVGDQVIYAVPGVPFEMEGMIERAVIPDLKRRARSPSTIVSRVLNTWGLAESTLAERISSRVDAQTNPTVAFLASGVKGIKVRITAKAPDEATAAEMLDVEEAELRALLGEVVFGVDDQSMEKVVGALLEERGWTVGVAESLTGGLVGARLAEAEGSSAWFRGSVVAYHAQVKFDLLDVPEGPVVTAAAALAMARGAAKVLSSDVGLGITGVAGPTTQDGQPVGTVFMAVAFEGEETVVEEHFPGDRRHVRQFSAISLLDLLRRRLLDAR